MTAVPQIQVNIEEEKANMKNGVHFTGNKKNGVNSNGKVRNIYFKEP